MLQKLNIQNFAIIRQVEVNLAGGLNIFTGETGAGKSIILDAIDLVLGARADIKGLESSSQDKTIIEAEFLLDKKKFEPLFVQLDVDFDPSTIVRREILPNGKSRSFINDTPVSLQQLRMLTSQLVSMHSQHENTELTERWFQFNLLDAYARIKPELADYKASYKLHRKNEQRMKELLEQQQQLMKEKDYLEFLLGEFEAVNLQEGEEEKLEAELNLLSNAESIVQVSSWIVEAVQEGESSVVEILTRIRNRLKQLENVNNRTKELSTRLQSSLIELKDIAAEAADLKSSVTADESRMDEINSRLNTIQGLKRKHGANGIAELLREYEKIAQKHSEIGNIDEEINTLRKSNEALSQALTKTANQLHDKRVKAAAKLKSELETLLKALEMPNAVVNFELSETDQLDEYGKTELRLLFTANLGMTPQLLSKVASGGELGRLALCIRSIEAANASLSVLIFDEIDTGVSGKVASTMGRMFKQIATHHQVIAITHLPQVAAYGDEHFMVGKKEEDNRTVSYVRQLDRDERVEELAKMLSGNKATEHARKNALELLKV